MANDLLPDFLESEGVSHHQTASPLVAVTS